MSRQDADPDKVYQARWDVPELGIRRGDWVQRDEKDPDAYWLMRKINLREAAAVLPEPPSPALTVDSTPTPKASGRKRKPTLTLIR